MADKAELKMFEAMFRNITVQLKVNWFSTKQWLFQDLKVQPNNGIYFSSGKTHAAQYNDQKYADLYIIFILSVFGISFGGLMFTWFNK